MATIADLIPFFPVSVQLEAQAALGALLSNGTIKNDRVADVIKTDPNRMAISLMGMAPNIFLDLFHNNVITNAQQIWTEYGLTNPSSGTKREQQNFENIWNLFYASFTEKRRPLVRFFGETYQLDSRTPSFESFSTSTLTDFANILRDQTEFYLLLSNYYISVAQSFVSRNLRSYQLLIKVNDQTTDRPLAHARISGNIGADGSSGFAGLSFEDLQTNAKGISKITFSYDTPINVNLSLTASITKAGFSSQSIVSQNFDPSSQSVSFTVNLTREYRLSSAQIQSVATNLGIVINPDVITFLNSNNIVTFRDLRKIGFLRNQKNLNVDKSNTSLRQIDALASFELITSDFAAALALTAGEIWDPGSLAAQPRSSFLTDYQNEFSSPTEALRVHENAVVYKDVSVATVASFPSLTPGTVIPAELDLEPTCGCSECNSSVGPMAYVSDLLNFVYLNLEDGESAINEDWLKSNLYQPFMDLPITCSELENSICQARIAAEVLARYFPFDSGSAEFQLAYKNYIVEVYKGILISLGTSYDELRRAQFWPEDSDELIAYCNRLRIPVMVEIPTDTDPIDEVSIRYMFYDIDSMESGEEDPRQLTEFELYKVFGYLPVKPASTSYNPPYYDEITPYINSWREEFLREQWLASKKFNDPYSLKDLPIIDPDIVTIDDFRSYTLINTSNRNLPFRIWVNRTQYLLGSRIQSSGGTLGWGYLVLKFELTSVAGRIDQYLGRSVVYRTTANTNVTVPVSNPPSIALMEQLRPLILAGDQAAIDQIKSQWNMLVPEFQRILELNDKGNDSNLTEEEIEDSINIVLAIQKRVLTSTWIQEEEVGDVILSAKYFWIAENEPKTGKWPFLNIDRPLIDPQNIGRELLPESTFNAYINSGSIIYDGTTAALNGVLANLPEAIPAAVDYAFEGADASWNNPATTYQFLTLNQELNDPASSDEARADIEQNLQLSIENFLFIVELGQRYETDPDATITDAERDRFNSLMLNARKVFSLFSEWLTAEKTDTNIVNIPNSTTGETTSRDFWILRKQQLPAWRASTQQRATWKQALIKHNEQPIIDPDLIGPAYIKNPQTGDPAFDLWLARYNQIHAENGLIDDIRSENVFFSTSGQPSLGSYNDVLEKILFSGVEIGLENLKQRIENNESLRARLDQLNINFTEYEDLITIYNDLNLAQPLPLSPVQRDKVLYLLVRVSKRRTNYEYSIEEQQEGITQSQDFFKVVRPDYSVNPPRRPYPIDSRLVDPTLLDPWLNLIASRVDQERNVGSTLDEMLLEIDDEFMPQIRDLVISTTNTESLPFGEWSRDLGDKLLINLEDNCCTKTNRVAQAIETLQQLVWKTRNGDILQHYPNLNITLLSFDESWQWMGSYASWRASMFVFMYPENLLLPALNPRKTPLFNEIVNELADSKGFTPVMACDYFNRYNEYIQDISTLRLVGSVEAAVVTQKGDQCNGVNEKIENLVFVVGNCTDGTRPYYSILTNHGDSLEQRTPWARIPNIPDNASLKGVDVFYNTDRSIRHLYFFYLVDEFDKRNHIYAIRYNVQNASWVDGILDWAVIESDFFEVDTEETGLTFDIQELVIPANMPAWYTPMLVISLKNDSGLQVFHHRLDYSGEKLITGESWQKWYNAAINLDINESDPDAIISTNGYTSGAIQKVIRTVQDINDLGEWYEDYYIYFSVNENSNIPLLTRSGYLSNEGGNYAGTIEIAALTGAQLFTVPGSYRVFAYFYESGLGGILSSSEQPPQYYIPQGRYAEIEIPAPQQAWENINLEDRAFFTGLDIKIGSFASDQSGRTNTMRPLIYQQKTDQGFGQIYARTWKYDESLTTPQIVFGQELVPLLPKFSKAPTLSIPVNPFQREIIKQDSQIAYESNEDSSNLLLLRYVEEAYFSLPIQIATQLSTNGYYQEALSWYQNVYDFRAPEGQRKVYYGLFMEEALNQISNRADDWFKDPLNPHGIAVSRQNAYTRYTAMSIANTLMAYGNAEFTMDTSESVPRARELYEDVIDVLSPYIALDPCKKDADYAELQSYIDNDAFWYGPINGLLDDLFEAELAEADYNTVLTELKSVFDTSQPGQDKYAAANAIIQAAITPSTTTTIQSRVSGAESELARRSEAWMAVYDFESIYEEAQIQTRRRVDESLTAVTGYRQSELDTVDLGWMRNDGSLEFSPTRTYDPNAVDAVDNNYDAILDDPNTAQLDYYDYPQIYISGLSFLFCVPQNPILTAIRMGAEANLYKINNCMNLAGMVRELNPFAAPTDSTSGIPVIGAGGTLQLPQDLSIPPSNYRYAYLLDRAKQLVAVAQQVESALLSALEKYDAESYARLRAEQDIDTARATIKLQDFKVQEAETGITLAEQQKERAEIQSSGLQNMIDSGLLSSEKRIVAAYTTIALLRATLSALQQVAKTSELTLQATAAGGGVSALASVAASIPIAIAAGAASVGAIIAETAINTLEGFISVQNIYATQERREQEWSFQKTLADQDIRIGETQIKLANDRLRVVGQEREIADLQLSHAIASLDFLKTKFTNAELYRWMSGILEDVYSFFLREATVVAKLAERQLAFERQVSVPPYIQSDYWAPPQQGFGLGTTESPDRRGLTGSVRLLRDITEMDQYYFNFTSPKLQLSKTFSLQELDPVMFAEFIQTGRLPIYTTESMFNRDYPGHYLRLIKRVSVTVVALNSPIQGIKGTLKNTGSSRTVTGGIVFQPRLVYRTPQQIALSSGVNDSGIFVMQPQSQELLSPFEGLGVETNWEFVMEKAANNFDYNSIADVYLTIDYEALHDGTYELQIKNQLNTELRQNALVLSFRNNLPDQWFQLHNSLQQPAEDQMRVKFDITRTDLAANVINPTISAVKVFLITESGNALATGEFEDMYVSRFNSQGEVDTEQNMSIGGPGVKDFGNFNSASPVGKWGLRFNNDDEMRALFREEGADISALNADIDDRITDIVFIIQYNSDTVLYYTGENNSSQS